MSRSPEPVRSPIDLWAVLGEHPTQRHHDLLAERLHHLAGIPDRRPHRIRRLLLTLWFRPPPRKPLPQIQGRSPGSRLRDQVGEPLHLRTRVGIQ